jgi:short-subunit dehydrogenase
MQRIIIIGAASAIATETARLFARDRSSFFLVGRNIEKLVALKDDLLVRGAEKVDTYTMDANDVQLHDALLKKAIQSLGEIDALLVAYGTLPDQKLCEVDANETMREFTTNCLSVIALLIPFVLYFENRRQGCLAVLSSVAGDRGRQSNYLYGSAKGAVSIYLQGLRNRLNSSGVQVLTIKPGLVDTPMTTHLPKNIFYAKPQDVGKSIYRAMCHGGKNILYVPWFWKIIMTVIKLIPERVFKKLSL